jgi:hypothetical protein
MVKYKNKSNLQNISGVGCFRLSHFFTLAMTYVKTSCMSEILAIMLYAQDIRDVGKILKRSNK